jgi:hypothetical protein
MKNLSEWKKSFKVGDIWETFDSRTGQTVRRSVYLVQSNAVAFKSVDPNRTDISWRYWPLANDCTFINNGDGVLTIRIENDVIPGAYLVDRKVETA